MGADRQIWASSAPTSAGPPVSHRDEARIAADRRLCVRRRTTNAGQFVHHALRRNRWLPDHFSYLDEELFRPYLAGADTHHVVQPLVSGIVADVGQPAHDLSCAFWIGATIPTTLEQNRGAVVGRDRGVKV